MIQCVNHPDRPANNLCLSCGKWYCDSCMNKASVPPLCRSCAGQKNAGNPLGNAATDLLSSKISARTLKTLAKIGLCVSAVVIIGLTILFNTKGIAFLFDMDFGFLRFAPAFFALVLAGGGLFLLRNKGRSVKKETITPAQIETLLKVDNKLTPKRLASATGTSEEYAKKFLNDLTVEGKLIASTEAYEMVYSKPLLQGNIL